MVLFLSADGVGWLLAARVVQGLATGALTSTLGAALLDLQHRDRPLGAFINSASPGLGLSLGAVGRRPAGAVRPVADRLGVRRPDRRVPAGRRRRAAAAAGDLAPAAGRAGLAAPAGARARRRTGRAFLVALPLPGRRLGARRALRLARAVAGGRRLRHRQPPRRRPADPRAQRHRHARLARPARRRRPSGRMLVGALVFTVGVRGHRGRPVRRVGWRCCSSPRWSPGSASAPRSSAPSRRSPAASPPGTGPGCWPPSSSSATWRSACRRSPRGSPSARSAWPGRRRSTAPSSSCSPWSPWPRLLRAPRRAAVAAAARRGGRDDADVLAA